MLLNNNINQYESYLLFDGGRGLPALSRESSVHEVVASSNDSAAIFPESIQNR